MLEIRFHGRGGQGTVLAAKILADAVLRSGRGQCLAIPEFGVERRGAPVTAYARISEGPIVVRTRIYAPDALVVLDPTLFGPETLKGLKPGGAILINSEKDAARLAERTPGFLFVPIPATRIALERRLGSPSSPVVNTAMCGATAAYFGLCGLDELVAAVRAAVPVKIEENADAAREGFDCLREDIHA